jgi:anti-anti-sigma factor
MIRGVQVSGSSEFGVRRVRRSRDAVVVVVRGELDLATAGALEEVLEGSEAQARTVVLDLREVTFMDSSGLNVVAAQHRRAQADGFDFAVAVGGAPHVERLFSLSGLAGTLALVQDPDALVGCD